MQGYTGGFSFETFDATAARVSHSHIASKLANGPRDDAGRFRVAKGTSSLAAVEDGAKHERHDEEKTPRGVALVDASRAVSCEPIKRLAGALPGVDAASKRAKRAAAAAAAEAGEDGNKKKKVRGGPPAWLSSGLVVKVLAKSLKEEGHYRRKGIVRGVTDERVGSIEMLPTAGAENDDAARVTLKVHERDLETVLPAPGKPVRVVKGAHAGVAGELIRLHEDRFLAEVAVDAADGVRQRVEYLQYDEVCKVHRG